MLRIPALLVLCAVLLTSPATAGCVFTLHDPVGYPAGELPKDIATADFNGDGYDDVVVRLEGGSVNKVAVLLADGNGGLGTAVEHTMDPYEIVGDIATGDINGDGHPDIVAATGANDDDNGRVNVLFGNGAGGFTRTTPYSFIRFSEIQNPYAVTVADFNHDGKDDIGVAAITSFVVIVHGPTGLKKVFDVSYQKPGDSSYVPLEITDGDFDGDGHVDVVLSAVPSEVLHTFFGDGDGTFTTGPQLAYDPAFWPDALATGDFDGDGDDDLAEAENGYEGQRLNIYVSNGQSRTFAARVEHAAVGDDVDEARSTDIDGDGDIDLILSTWGMDVLLNDGAGNFASKTTYGDWTENLDIGDIDGNGSPDAVTYGAYVLLNGCARATTTLVSSANPSTVNSAVTFTASIAPPPSGLMPSGTLTLKRDGTTLATRDLATGFSLAHAMSDLSPGVHTITADYSGDSMFATTSMTLEQIVQLPPFGAPTQTTATYSAGTVTVTWIGTRDVDHYEVWRSSGSQDWTRVATPGGAMVVDASVLPSVAYLYKVRGVTASNDLSPFGTPDLTHTFAFTDPILTAGSTPVRLAHLTELRLVIQSARAVARLSAPNWAEPSPAVIKASHWLEAQAQLDPVRSSIGIPAAVYTSTPAKGSIIRADSVRDLRNALQ